MIAVPLAVVALTLAPSGESSRLQIDAAFALDARSMSATPPPISPPSGRWVGGSGDARATVYHHAIVDDDAPPALQPFLQRASSLSLEGGAGAADILYPFYVLSAVDPAGFELRYRSTLRSVHGSTSADGVIGRYLRLSARLGFAYDTWEPNLYSQTIAGFGNVTPISTGTVAAAADSNELALDAAASVGLRWRDLLLAAGWDVKPFRVGNEPLHVRFWGGAFVDVRAVIGRRFDLTAHADVLDGGAAGNVELVAWLRRCWGLAIGVEGGHGAFADSPDHFDRAGGHVGVSWWLATRIAVSLRYGVAWQSPTPLIGLGSVVSNFSIVQHLVTLTLTVRPRTR